MLREIQRMTEVSVKKEEVSLARASLIGGLYGRFEVSEDTVATLSDLYVYNLGASYYNQYVTKINAVSTGDARRIARKYLTVQKPLVLAVGDRAKIEQGLKQLGLGTPELRDVDGNVLPEGQAQAARQPIVSDWRLGFSR